MGKWEKLHCAAEALLERIVFKRWVAMVLAVAIALSCVPLGAVHVHAEEENTITVRASVPNTWTNPCIWAWDNSNTEAFDQWPGEPMKDGGDGWWYATIPAWVENIIINANGGNSQTVDLALEQRGVDVSVTVVLGADWKAEAHLEYGALPGKSPALSVQATAPETTAPETATPFNAADWDYVINTDNTVSITAYTGSNSVVAVPAEVEGLPVTAIEAFAFQLNNDIVNVVIPEGVTSIGECAFFGCMNLETVVIREGVTSIPDQLFLECGKLRSVELPEGVASIGNSAFAFCSSLENVNIPSSVTSIGECAFERCRSLTEIILPAGLESVSRRAFVDCSKATSVTVPGSVTDIGEMAFLGCVGLVNVTIQEGVSSIGVQAFGGCSNMTSIALPSTMTSIGGYAFANCESLQSITIPNCVTKISEYTFLVCESLTNIELPESITAIEMGAFMNCSSLTAIAIPESVEDIGERAFSSCSALKSIELPRKITGIGDGMFYKCGSLESIAIPESVVSVAYGAFEGCNAVSNVYYGGTQEQWDAIQVNSYGGYNDTLLTADRHYGDAVCAHLFVNGICSKCGKIEEVESTETTEPATTEPITTVPATTEPVTTEPITTTPVATAPTTTVPVTTESATTAPATTEPVTTEPAADIVASGICGENLAWALDKAGTLTISGSGAMNDYTNFGGEAPWYAHAGAIKNVKISSGVTSIGDYAFYKCKNLKTIELPEGIADIGSYAFYNCEDLAGVQIPAGTTSIGYGAFSYCCALKSVTIPEGVTSIDVGAFAYCSALSAIEIPESVNSIGEYAFQSCVALTRVVIPEGVSSIGGYTFTGCSALTSVVIPEGVTGIGSSAFYGCRSLTSVVIPEGVTSIGSSAFEGCSSLESITLPESATSIGDHAFSNCSSLESITLPESVTSIGNSAFSGCSSLTSIVIPEGVTSIGDYAFYNCSSLTSITLPEGVTSIGSSAFYNCSSLTSVVIPTGVTSIGYDAFYGCSSLESITLPEGVTSIGSWAFHNCSSLVNVYVTDIGAWLNISFDYEGNPLNANKTAKNLYLDGELVTELVIPEGITTIPEYAFYCCSSLKSITIPESVTSIGDDAFYGCSSLESITLPESVTSIGSWAFYGCDRMDHVFYGGTEEQWATVTVDSYNTPLTSAIRHCESAGDLTTTEQICSGVLRHCTDCGGYYKFTAKSTATHSFVEGVCEHCGVSDDWTYTISTNAAVTITGYSGAGGNVVMPANIEGLPVTAFTARYYSGVFYGNSKITSVVLPEGLRGIPNYAFSDCSSLTSVVIPTGVTSIGDYAFDGCSSLESITLPEGMTSIGDYAFDGCSSLESITLPESVTSIGSWAFYDCDRMDHVFYGGTEEQWATVTVDSYNTPLTSAIRHCESAGDLTTTEQICSGVLRHCTDCGGYYKFTAKSTATHSFVEGVCEHCGVSDDWSYTISNTGTVTITGYSGPGGEVVIPAAIEGLPVVAIGGRTFSGSGVVSVTLPEKVIDIADNAFTGVTAQIYYPAGSEWAQTDFPDYGGDLTWVPNGTMTGLELLTDAVLEDYYIGDKLDLDAILVQATFTGGIKQMLPASVMSISENPTLTYAGKRQITLTYQGFSVELTVMVHTAEHVDGAAPSGDEIRITDSCGWTIYYCTLCEEEVHFQIKETKTHSYGEDGICTKCGVSDDWAYTISEDREVIISGCNGENVTVPETIEGLPVVAIGGRTFSGSGVVSVTLPEKVITIADDAFAGVTATVFYPVASAWPIDAAYGGELTWVPVGEITGLELLSDTVLKGYKIGDTLDLDAILVQATFTGGIKQMLPASVMSISENPTLTYAGKRQITLTYQGFSVELTVLVHTVMHGLGEVLVDPSEYPESAHNYGNYISDVQTLTVPGAQSLILTFSDSTRTETGYDYIYVYDGDDNLIGQYDGTEAAGLTVTIPSDTVKVKLTSDGSQTYYGYSFSAINAVMPAPSGDEVRITDSCSWTSHYCTLCEEELSFAVKADAEHTFGEDGICTKCGVSDDWEYTVSEGGEVRVDRYLDEGPKVIFPATIEGLPVTTIMDLGDSGYSILANPSKITEVVLPEGLISIGSSAFEGCSSLESITLPEGVTSIGSSAFSGCSSLTSVVIPTGVTSIGDRSFYNCSSLESITLPEGVTSIGNAAFYNCSSLESITLPEGVTSIGDSAFYGCSSLMSVVLPESITNVGRNAFGYNNNLPSYSHIYYGGTAEQWSALREKGSLSFDPDHYSITDNYIDVAGSCTIITYYCELCEDFFGVTNRANGEHDLTDGVCSRCNMDAQWETVIYENIALYISRYLGTDTELIVPSTIEGYPIGGLYPGMHDLGAFEGNTSIVSVYIPDGVRDFDGRVFTGCTSLQHVRLPADAREIASEMFAGCTNLTGITIPNSVTSIGNAAFSGCSSLTNIVIPDSVTSIGESAFSGCSNLESITLPFVGRYEGSLYTFGYIFGTDSYTGGVAVYQAAASWSYNGTYYLPASLRSVTVTGGEIPYGAFSNCSMLAVVRIAEGVTSIGDRSFYNCSSLTSITLPEGVTSIGDRSFYNCSSLTSIVLPEGVTSVESYAFSGCSGLISITIPASMTNMGNGAFNDCSNLLHVFYGGTQEQWIALGTEEHEGSYYLSAAFFHYEASGGVITSRDLCTVTAYHCNLCDDYFFYKSNGGEHTFVDGVCTECGVSEDWEYTISENGEVRIDRYLGEGPKVIFPATIEGLPVTTIMDLGDSGYSILANPSKITEVVLPEGLISIGSSAFYNCSNLTSITIPDSVVSIGWGAFSDCSSLTSITLPEGLTSIGSSAFYNCSNLTSITLPDSVTSIGWGAFSDCSSLTSITLPEGLTSIGYSAFSGCSSLTSVTLPEGLTSIEGHTFYGCENLATITLPEYLKSIDEYAFYGCVDLTIMTIPETVTYIGSGAFSGCTNLVKVNIPAGVTEINEDTFYDCEDLVSIQIPEGVTRIGGEAFYGCQSLQKVTIPSTLRTVGHRSFYDCYKLTGVYICDLEAWFSIEWQSDWSWGTEYANPLYFAHNLYLDGELATQIVVPDTVTKINPYTFVGASCLQSIVFHDKVTAIGDHAFYGCSGLTELVLPDSITSIGTYAFYDCSSIANTLVLPEKLTSVTDYAFSSCDKIPGIVFPDALRTIGVHAFSYCHGLKTVTIPENVTYIDDYAFYNCRELVSAYIPGGVVNVDVGAFDDCYSMKFVLLPDTLVSIGSNAFPEELDHVLYAGTEAQWGEVVVSEYNEPLNAATIHYGCDGTEIVIADLCTVTVLQCEVCNKNILATTNGGEHTFVDGVCTECGISDDWKYAISEDAQVTITGYCGVGGNVVIPKTIEGLPVTIISGSAFSNCSSLTSIVIPEGVTSIGYEAFSNCSSLTSITLPESLTRIDSHAFYNCRSLTSIVLPEGLTSIDSCAFYNCRSLTSIVIPEGVTSIGYEAFYNCSSLTSIVIPEGVTSISGYAFSGCSRLWHVLYGGTEEQWNNIYIDYQGSYFQNAISHYNCTGNEITASSKESCTHIGLFDCSVCGETTWQQKPQHGHNYMEDTCTKCGDERTLDGIYIGTYPSKTVYKLGEELDLTGMTIFARYFEEFLGYYSEEITDYVLNGYYKDSAGWQYVTVLWGGMSASFEVYVEAPAADRTLTGITILQNPQKLTYIEGQKLDITGLVVRAQYSDGSAQNVTGYSVSGYDANKVGKQTITVTYGDETATFTVEVKAKSLTGISISKNPTKVTYLEGEKLDTAGLTITATYDNGTTATVTGWKVSGYDANKVGKQTITVTYGGKTATFTVEVKAKSLTGISVSKNPTKLTYLEGEKLDTTGLVIQATYNNGTSANVTGWTVSGYDANKVGKQTVTVTYGGKTATFTVEVKAKSLTGISVSKNPTKLTYVEGEKLDTTGLVIKATYNNGTSANVTGWKVSGYDANKVGKQTVTVTYGGKTATFTVEVKAKSLTGISVSKNPTKLTYLEGEKLDTTGLVIKATYNNGTSANVTGWTVSGYDANKVGKQTVTVTYGGKTATFTVTVEAAPKPTEPKPTEPKPTEPKPTEPVVPDSITSEKYPVKDGYIRKIAIGTTAGTLINGIREKLYVMVYDGKTVVKEDALVGTGMVVQLKDGNQVKDFVTVIVTGDVNGDGKITVTDMIATKSHLLGKSKFTGAAEKASDTNGDGKISITDFIQLKAHILGKSAVAPN